MKSSTLVAAAAAAVAGTLYLYWRSTPGQRIKQLIKASEQAYHAKEYEAAVAKAREALELANDSTGSGSAGHLAAMMHLAGLHGAMRKFDEALDVLETLRGLTVAAHGARSLELVPVLHATAECLEGAGKPPALATEQLALAREIRCEKLGDKHADYASACVNLSCALVAQAASSGYMAPAQRSGLVSRATKLVVEASGIAVASGDSEHAADLMDAALMRLLDVNIIDETELTMLGGGRAVGEAGVLALLDAYKELTGEAWMPPPEEEEDDDDGGEEGGEQ